jgi:hypothetical protein
MTRTNRFRVLRRLAGTENTWDLVFSTTDAEKAEQVAEKHRAAGTHEVKVVGRSLILNT